MTKQQYKWGETPLGKLSHAELLEAAHRLYAASVSAQVVLQKAAKLRDEPYWRNRNGTGAIALERVNQAIEVIDGDQKEPAYNGFYKYAGALLFDSTHYDTGSPWLLCNGCGQTICTENPNVKEGDACRIGPKGCEGTYITITWDILKPSGTA